MVFSELNQLRIANVVIFYRTFPHRDERVQRQFFDELREVTLSYNIRHTFYDLTKAV